MRNVARITALTMTETVNTAARASKSRESGFRSVSSINYASAMDRRASSEQSRIQNHVCHILAKLEKNVYLKSMDSLAAGGQNLALSRRSSPLALQFLVQQRHFMSSIEQVPVVPRSDSFCTSHPRFDPLKRTTDGSKENNKRKAYKIIALRCELEGLKAEKSDAQQAPRRAEIRAARAEGKAKEYRERLSSETAAEVANGSDRSEIGASTI